MKIPYMCIRGGSSKGLYFNAHDLPKDETERNNVLLMVMEGTSEGDPRQIDGLGGATSLTSKIAIVSKSKNSTADLDYLFVQVVVGKGQVSTTQTCGNILAGVGHFAITSGLITTTDPYTSIKVNIVNTGGICDLIIPTPNGKIQLNGSAKVDGVPGTSAAIVCNYLDTIGATCGALLPTGYPADLINDIETTCIDNGMPVVMMRASDFGLSGNESVQALEENQALKQQIEDIRLQAGLLMNLGNVKNQTIPKMCLISAPAYGGTLNTRMFIPHVVHEAIGVLAAVSVATACIIKGTICFYDEFITNDEVLNAKDDLIKNNDSSLKNSSLKTHHSSLSIEHPSGEFTVNLSYEIQDNAIKILKSGVIRTARIISEGLVYVGD
jgi:4-oxalomesaconate tautomerase